MSRSSNRPMSPNRNSPGNVTLTFALSVRLRRMAAQLRRRLIDAADVRPHGLPVGAPGHDEVAVVGARALQIVDHQSSPLPPHPPLQALPRREQGYEIFRALRPRDGDAAAPQPSRHFRRRRRALFELFILVHADTPRLNTPQNRRPDSSTATAPPAPPRRPPDDCWPARVCWRGGWGSCRSTGWRRIPGRC